MESNERLSQLQRQVLEYLHTHAGQWRPREIRTRDDWRPTDRAVLSRSLAELERRGLVIRDRRNGRTASVALTPDGAEIAAEIASAPERIKALLLEGERMVEEMKAAAVVPEKMTPALQAKTVRLFWAAALQQPKIYTDYCAGRRRTNKRTVIGALLGIDEKNGAA